MLISATGRWWGCAFSFIITDTDCLFLALMVGLSLDCSFISILGVIVGTLLRYVLHPLTKCFEYTLWLCIGFWSLFCWSYVSKVFLKAASLCLFHLGKNRGIVICLSCCYTAGKSTINTWSLLDHRRGGIISSDTRPSNSSFTIFSSPSLTPLMPRQEFWKK